jgi:hypothetical protein
VLSIRPQSRRVRVPFLKFLCATLVALTLLSPALGFGPSWGANTGRVVGRIVGAGAKEVSGAKVVLVQFKLDAQGVPQGAPIQSQDADSQGRYEFKQIPVEPQTVYKLARVSPGAWSRPSPLRFPMARRRCSSI